jgi:hypothetical protein
MPKLPKYEVLNEAIRSYDTRSLTATNVDSLLSVWPKDVEISDMLNEQLVEGETWDRAEAYFIKLCEPVDVKQRLEIWQWKT